MLSKLIAVAVGGLIATVAFDGLPPFTGPYPLLDRDHAAPMVSWRPFDRRPRLRVLFIGNSFTFTHDIPAQVVNLASADAQARVGLEVSASTIPGGSLQQAWSQGDALRRLQATPFDVVVLQDWSIWPFREDVRSGTYDAVGRWAAAARQAGARPVFYQTWADKAGSESYQPGWPYAGMTPDSTQGAMDNAAQALAATYRLPLVDAGETLVRLEGETGAPELYGPDAHHPSVAGAFLSAAILYQALTGDAPSRSTYRPAGLSEADRAAILTSLPPPG